MPQPTSSPPPTSSYASSTYSSSTTCTVDGVKAPAAAAAGKSRRSLGEKFKSVLSSLGEDPAARHDRKHGLEARGPTYTPALPVSRI